jgi:hypothetical protein
MKVQEDILFKEKNTRNLRCNHLILIVELTQKRNQILKRT